MIDLFSKTLESIITFYIAHLLWLIPLVSIGLTILVKVTAKTDRIPLHISDFFDWGLDLWVTSTMLLMANLKDKEGCVPLLMFIALLLIVTDITRRLGWDEQQKSYKGWAKFVHLVLQDLLGGICLFVATIYIIERGM